MEREVSAGVWPTMITPFTEKNEVDYAALERLIEWYIARGVSGLFAVCQSSEMFRLSLEERVRVAAFVKQKAAGRVPVVASGHIADRFEDQRAELVAMAATGIDALVLITNRLAEEGEPDNVWERNLRLLLAELPEDVPLGFYECPYPYKRLLTPELLGRCARTGRFRFLKDTSCDAEAIRDKLAAVSGTGLRLYNANSATLLQSLRLGAAGYSGVMANFHPELYVWLTAHGRSGGEEAERAAGTKKDKWTDRAERLSDFLSIAALIERQSYPMNAKYHLMRQGVLDNYRCRTADWRGFTPTCRLEVEQLDRMAVRIASEFRLPDGDERG